MVTSASGLYCWNGTGYDLVGNPGNLVQGPGSDSGSSFALPAGDQIATGFAYDAEDQAPWFGTNDGVLYSLNKALHPINHTPFGNGSADPSTGSGQAPSNPIPPSVARYQTHLTVVDNQKNPQPFETVKLSACG